MITPRSRAFADKMNPFRRRRRVGAGSLLTALPFLLPALLIMGVIIVYPLLDAARLSLFEYTLTEPGNVHISFPDNYVEMVSDPVFWEAMKVTFIFTASTVVIACLIGLVMALTIFELSQMPFFRSLRGVLLVPWVIPGIVIGYLFLYMFDVEIGIINYVMQQLGVIEEFLPWVADSFLAMVSIVVAHVWNQTPFYLLMFTAGLMAIPDESWEAAYLEGASRWQEFRHVTFHYLQEILMIATLLMVIRNFNFFPIIYTMTGGGPAYSTTTAVLYIYRQAFQNFSLGYASAIGTVWVVILLLVSVVYTRTLRERF